MKTFCGEIVVRTKGEGDILDITELVEAEVRKSQVTNGVAHLYVVGSTAAITTMEYEPGLIRDIGVSLERLAPKNYYYEHRERWGDDNGHSHVRASLIGPSLSIPVRGGGIVTGTWQQIVLLELDTRRRERRIMVTVMGD